MAASDIVVKGAREHNLRSVDVRIPRNQLVCLTGVSGSGKSSLAFDTLYAEGQRRYVQSLSTFARQFLGQMPKPEVDHISGLSPSISIAQKTAGQNPRSTVGTVTEIYDYLRVLYARIGVGHCPLCEQPITAQSREQIIARVLDLPNGTRYAILAPIIRRQKGEYRDLFVDLMKQGFLRARADGAIVRLSDDLKLDRQMRHDIEVVVDRLTAGKANRARVAEAVDIALRIGEGELIVATQTEPSDDAPATTKKRGKAPGNQGDVRLSSQFACLDCGLSFAPPSPQLFSFNSPQGMCETCDGLGQFYSFDRELLIPDPSKSFKQGCIELVGSLADMGRWQRHIYQGVADTIERMFELDAGTLLDSPWRDLTAEFQDIWLWGTGDTHITFTWRKGLSGAKHGGTFDGVIPSLLTRYGSSKSKMQIRQYEKYMRVIECPDCFGGRLNPQAACVTIKSNDKQFADHPQQTLPELCKLPVSEAEKFFSSLELDAAQTKIAEQAIKEIRGRLGFLTNVGLDYLSLARTAPTLSGGEMQRIRLAGQIGSGLVGVMYILDEPSIGLHPRDNDRLLSTLQRLRDMGNTVIVVEHDEDTMRAADHMIDFGPGPGVKGGYVVATGPASRVMKEASSITGQYLSGKQKIDVPSERRAIGKERLTVHGARQNNLKNVDVEIPLGALVCVTGVSGSGKSSLVGDILVEALRRDLNGGKGEPGEHEKISGLKHLDKLIAIDQSPIGRTPRSNPGTYIKVFDEIRTLYTQLPDARRRGYKPGRFSFNVSGGRCEACEGNGSNKLEMDFLADVWVTCAVCSGHRFNRETLQIRYKGKSIADVLEMDVQQALEHFANIPKIQNKLQTLHDVGLDYLKIGQPSPTLSGGEAQRIKLARELVKKSTGQTLYLLDEPTTGLHFADIKMLLKVLHNFADAGNTVLVVEHNLDVVKTADWIIDLGPEGGAAGGQIVAVGTPEGVARNQDSHTGRALAPLLGIKTRAKAAAKKKSRAIAEVKSIKVTGARQHNLKDVAAEIPRDKMTVCCGPSGSGKTSLAMDTIYAEGQRRYVESLGAYARQFVGQMEKPHFEHIEGLSPAVAIEQKNMGQSPRSTVGTVTEIYDYLRILFARLGTPFCPACETPIGSQTVDEIVDKIMAEPTGTKLYIMAPISIHVGESYETLWDEMRASGYARIRVDGQTYSLETPPNIDRRRKHELQIVIDRVVVNESSRSRIAESTEAALSLGSGTMSVAYPRDGVAEERWQTRLHSQHFVCDCCSRSFEPLTPHHFSFNSSLGWCDSCEGLGTGTGADPAALIRDPKLSLADGAIALWPDVRESLAKAMLAALCKQQSIPADVPLVDLPIRERRLIFYGTGDDWIDVYAPGGKKHARPLFRFQYKGLYPALAEAARLSPSLRAKLAHLVAEVECGTCGGSRLRDDASAVQLHGHTIDDLCRMPLDKFAMVVDGWQFDDREKKVAGELVREIANRTRFLLDVGLDYLTVARGAATLSGGEAQRIRLASQVGSGLCGVLYVLDEPTIGLHPRDNRRLITALERLRDLGNTLLVVEHDREVVASADQLLDFGPRAGEFGGEIVARGTPKQVSTKRASVTGPYLSGKKSIKIPSNRRMAATTNGRAKQAERPDAPGGAWLEVIGARHNNLHNVDAAIPLGTFTAVTGVSGSGKSSLVEDVLYRALAQRLHRANASPAPHDEIRGIEHINKVIRVDQQPLGNSPTSNPATYTGLFDLVRSLFAQLPEAKLRGYSQRRFSFNVSGGRCETCEGNGQLCVEMHFLPDVWVECDECHGKRYNPETLAVLFHGYSIADVLEMSCAKAVELFKNIPKIRRILEMLCDVGLDYLKLGQAAPTLSGGEAQRVKLAAELARPDTGQTLYLLDEPTTGLHFDDLAKLLDVLNRLVDMGNTVVVIEHNTDVTKTADWIIDIGPEAGAEGGRVVVAGTPEDIVSYSSKKSRSKKLLRSYTGEILKDALAESARAKRKRYNFAEAETRGEEDLEISQVGKATKMPWEVDGRAWHTKDRVARNGQSCKWDGQIVGRVVDHLEDLGTFGETNWVSRTVVEISGEKKADGWFLHAMTGDEWLVTLKFRVARNTFKKGDLVERLKLAPLNELDDLPVYGSDPRVKCKNLRGPWQEVQLRIATLAEIELPEFWKFLDECVAAFDKITKRKELKPSDIMPWTVLGEKWHLARKGFPPGKPAKWDVKVLEKLCKLLSTTAKDSEFDWKNQQVVHVYVDKQPDPWATIYTKRPASIELQLNGPKNHVALGRVAELAADRDVVTSRKQRDVVKLKFHATQDLTRGDLPEFLKEHLDAVRTNTNGKK